MVTDQSMGRAAVGRKGPGARTGSVMLAGVCVAALGLVGCATFSESLSDSVSKSVSSPFKWSSGSSSGSSDERKESYQGEVRRFAEVCSRSNGGVPELVKGVTAVAEKHGISNWEADLSTYVGIGEGLAKAGTPKPQLELYTNGLAKGDSTRLKALNKGLEQAG